MAISPQYDRCGQELSDYGAILLSPPKNNNVVKYHLCKKCYAFIEKELLKPPQK